MHRQLPRLPQRHPGPVLFWNRAAIRGELTPAGLGAGGHSRLVPARPGSASGVGIPGGCNLAARAAAGWSDLGGHTQRPPAPAPRGDREQARVPAPSSLGSLPFISRLRVADSNPPFDVAGFSLTQILPKAVPLLAPPPGFRTAPTAAFLTGVPRVAEAPRRELPGVTLLSVPARTLGTSTTCDGAGVTPRSCFERRLFTVKINTSYKMYQGYKCQTNKLLPLA